MTRIRGRDAEALANLAQRPDIAALFEHVGTVDCWPVLKLRREATFALANGVMAVDVTAMGSRFGPVYAVVVAVVDGGSLRQDLIVTGVEVKTEDQLRDVLLSNAPRGLLP